MSSIIIIIIIIIIIVIIIIVIIIIIIIVILFPSAGGEAHIDNIGRTYYMDHTTHTIHYGNSTSSQPAGVNEDQDGEGGAERGALDARREMLNRRYQSLHRSFRSAHHHRRNHSQQDFPSNLAPVESVGAISYVPLDNSETQDTAGDRGRRKDKGKSSTPSRGWFNFSRKSTNQRMVRQAESTSTISSDTIEVTSPPGPIDIFAPLSPPPPSLAELGITDSVEPRPPEPHPPEPRPLGPQESISSPTSSQQGSITESNGTINNELENTLTGQEALIAIVDQTHPQSEPEPRPPVSTDLDQAAAATVLQQQQRRRGRNSRTSHHSGDTDDETNEGVSPRNSVVISPSPNRGDPPTEAATRGEEAQGEQSASTAESTETPPTATPTHKESQSHGDRKKTRKKGGVKVASPIKFSDALKNSPALKFITRPDLYSFLNSAGVSLYTCTCTLYTVYCTVYTVYCILYTVYCILYSIHCTVYTVQCIFHELFSCVCSETLHSFNHCCYQSVPVYWSIGIIH